jgi:hypothetical protein
MEENKMKTSKTRLKFTIGENCRGLDFWNKKGLSFNTSPKVFWGKGFKKITLDLKLEVNPEPVLNTYQKLKGSTPFALFVQGTKAEGVRTLAQVIKTLRDNGVEEIAIEVCAWTGGYRMIMITAEGGFKASILKPIT